MTLRRLRRSRRGPGLAPLWLCVAGARGLARSASEGDGPLSGTSAGWRVINLQPVDYGWTVGELRLFEDTECQQELTAQDTAGWQSIASGQHDTGPDRALDGNTWTEWRAQCYLCDAREAWVGVAFDSPVNVRCVKLWQWGSRGYKTAEVMLEQWRPGQDGTAGAWRPVLRGSQLDGGRWDTIRFVTCAAVQPPDHGHFEVTNSGFYPSEARISCSGIRVLGGSTALQCQVDGSWSGEVPRCWPMLYIIILVSAVVLVDIMAFMFYYWFVVIRKAPALSAKSFLPEEYRGSWSHSIIKDVRNDPKRTMLWFLFCPCCRVAETWRGAGELPFHIGAPLVHLFFPLLPCLGAFYRVSMRTRFGIHNSRSRDFLMWCCCLPCTASQEAKHVDAMCEVSQQELEASHEEEKRKREESARLEAAKAEPVAILSVDNPDKAAAQKVTIRDQSKSIPHPYSYAPKSVMEMGS